MKEEWKKVKLGEIATFSNGINFGKESYTPGVKLIGVSNFGNRLFPDYEELEEVDEKVLRPNDYLKNGDIVFVRSNGNKELVGRCMLIQNPPSAVTYSGFCIRSRLNNVNENSPRFFAYYFKSKMFRKAMSNTAVGANIQNLNQGLLSNHELMIPPLPTQQKIASILSAYDDLIENNRRQIKLLEEAALKLYKEWFVKLNFPGHETTKIVDGVPDGWKEENLGNMLPIVTGKKDANYGTKNGKYPFFTCSQEPIKAPAYSFDANAILLAGNGDLNVKIYRGKFEAYQRTYVLVPNSDKHLFICYRTVQDNLRKLIHGASGSTIKFITKGMIENIKVLIPDSKILEKFNNYSETTLSKMESLNKQIQLLQLARDKLLPKLMNGEIEV
ncbi:MAG: restriction endonuclease subunit S [Treponema sp.]|nr:restriction endonuclease subunit S [Treponema sp.]MDY2925331.1 restriction endonuclease subunit S [Treponema sp.]